MRLRANPHTRGRALDSKSSFLSVTDRYTPSAYVLYLCRAMARKLTWSILIFGLGLVTLPVVCATQKPYAQGKFVAIQQKSRDRVDMYLVNTPITTAVPYFEITVEFGEVDYLAEYTPRHSGEELPEAWRPDEAVRGRVDKHHLYLLRPDGSEIEFIIEKKAPVGKK